MFLNLLTEFMFPVIAQPSDYRKFKSTVERRVASLVIQKIWRGVQARRQFKRSRALLQRLQAVIRARQRQREYENLKRAVMLAQKSWRGHQERNRYKATLQAVQRLQAVRRAQQVRKDYVALRQSAVVLEKAWRYEIRLTLGARWPGRSCEAIGTVPTKSNVQPFRNSRPWCEESEPAASTKSCASPLCSLRPSGGKVLPNPRGILARRQYQATRTVQGLCRDTQTQLIGAASRPAAECL